MSCKSNSFFKEGFQQNEDEELNQDDTLTNQTEEQSLFTPKTKVICILLLITLILFCCKYYKLKK
jgi:hypothetical protein